MIWYDMILHGDWVGLVGGMELVMCLSVCLSVVFDWDQNEFNGRMNEWIDLCIVGLGLVDGYSL